MTPRFFFFPPREAYVIVVFDHKNQVLSRSHDLLPVFRFANDFSRQFNVSLLYFFRLKSPRR